MTDKIQNMRGQIREVIKMIRKDRSGQSVAKQKELEEFEEVLALQIGPLSQATEKAQMIASWRGGNIPPQQYLQWLGRYRNKNPTMPLAEEDEEKEGNDPSVIAAKQFVRNTRGNAQNNDNKFADMTTDDLWKDGPVFNEKSTKIEAIQHIDDIAKTQDELIDVDGLLQHLKTVFDKKSSKSKKTVGEEIEAMLIILEKDDDESQVEERGQRFSIEWYSVMEIYNGTKGWWEKYAETWKEKARLRQGRIQHKVSKMMEWLPYGQEASKESTKALDGQHREAKGKHKEQMEDANPKFLALFGPDGEFNEFASGYNPDQLMAIIEHGASHGWLYDIKEKASINGFKIVKLLPKHWDDKRRAVYLDSIIGQNEDGFEKEADTTSKNIQKKYTTKSEFLSKELDGYLADVNIGAAMGTMRAMYERAIDGDEGPYIAAHFFRALNTNPELRRYMTLDRLQYISRASAGKGYFTMSNLWMDRWKLAKIHKNPNEPINMEEGGVLANAIVIAERQIVAASATPPDDNEMDELIAQFLSGKPLRLDKGVVSIWSKEFEFYRDESKNTNFKLMDASGVKDTANDYFASKSAEMLMTSQKFIRELFRTDSPQKWVNADKVENFIGKVFNMYTEMIEAYEGVHFADPADHPVKILKSVLGSKIQQAMLENIDRSEQIMDVELSIENTPQRGTKAVAALQAMEFIDLRKMGKKGEEYYDRIKENAAAIQANLPRIS